MSAEVLLACAGADWEPALVAAVTRHGSGLAVLRRCVDLTDLQAAAEVLDARVAIVHAGSPRLDRTVVVRLRSRGLVVIAVAGVGDDAALARTAPLVDAVVRWDPSDVAGVVGALARAIGERLPAVSPVALPAMDEVVERSIRRTEVAAAEAVVQRGRLVCVLGAPGSPGATSVAIGVAEQAGMAGLRALLVDADTVAASVAVRLGLVDEVSGLAAASRLASGAGLDGQAVLALAPEVTPAVHVLTGLTRPDHWPQLRPAALDEVWEHARAAADVVVVDLGCVPDDDAADPFAPSRSGPARSALSTADEVLVVGAAEPVALVRLVRCVDALLDRSPDLTVRVVLTRVRARALGPDPARRARQLLAEHLPAGTAVHTIADDRDAHDDAELLGRGLAQTAPGSAAVRDLAALAAPVLEGLSRSGATARAEGLRPRWRAALRLG